jgi:glycine dehydrogenase
MMRYIKSLETKDITLTRSMIPLGSCTMKLNAASEMIPMSWPELNLHPFVPKYQAKGYHTMIEQLRDWLKEITQFDDVSFQSNSGATG